MNYFSWLVQNYKYWKAFKKFPKEFTDLGKWPSETYMKYPPQHHFYGQKVLNFGCGTSVYKFPNVTNLDITPGNGVNIVDPTGLDSLKEMPSNSFDFIIANHVLEHHPKWFEAVKEFSRLLKPEGKLEIWIPPVSSDSSFTYRDHINRIGWESFFGCLSMRRSGANLAASDELNNVGDFAKMHLHGKFIRTKMKWWIMVAPPSLVNWMAEYLRNIVSEEGFIFIKRGK